MTKVIEADQQKIKKVLLSVSKVINKAELTIPELIYFYGNLGYMLGSSIGGFNQLETKPDEITLEREYRINPTIDLGFMLQGLLITTWVDSFIQKPVVSTLAQKLQKTTEEELGGNKNE